MHPQSLDLCCWFCMRYFLHEFMYFLSLCQIGDLLGWLQNGVQMPMLEISNREKVHLPFAINKLNGIKSGPSGDWTHDLQIISLALYQLSYKTIRLSPTSSLSLLGDQQASIQLKPIKHYSLEPSTIGKSDENVLPCASKCRSYHTRAFRPAQLFWY